MDAFGFRICFTPLTGVLFTVPSRYCALSVMACSLPWTVVRPASHEIARVSWYSRSVPQVVLTVVRDCHPLWCAVPGTSIRRHHTGDQLAGWSVRLTTPLTQRLPPWHVIGLGCGPFRSPLLRAVFCFLRVLRCFSSPTYLRLTPVPVLSTGGLPHSDTTGSPCGCHSPVLSLLTCVLPRHAMPRHPPNALRSLPGLFWQDHSERKRPLAHRGYL